MSGLPQAHPNEESDSSSALAAITVEIRIIQSGRNDNAGQLGSLAVVPSMTVTDLKQKIKSRFGVPAHEQTVLFRGGILRDTQTMADCGLLSASKESANLVVVQSRREGMVRPQAPPDSKYTSFRWDRDRVGEKLAMNPTSTRIWLSFGAWQTVEGDIVLSPGSGRHYWELTFPKLSVSKNTFAIVVGIVPDAPYTKRVNQPIGWAKVDGWGFVVGTGQILHKGKVHKYASVPKNPRLGILLDTDRGTLTFYLNGRSLGEAFSGINHRVRPALSCIQNQSARLLHTSEGEEEVVQPSSDEERDVRFQPHQNIDLKAPGAFSWVAMGSGVKLSTSRRRAQSSTSGWTTLVGEKVFNPGTGLHTWEISLNRIDTEKNVFGCVIGIVPADADAASNQPIGWKKVAGWGLVIGTGELLHRSTGLRYPGGVGAGGEGKEDVVPPIKSRDRIGLALDTDRGTLSFYYNGRDLGEAFTHILSPVRAALSCIQTQDTTLYAPAPFHRRLALALSLSDHKVEFSQEANARSFRWEQPERGQPEISPDGRDTSCGSSGWRSALGDKIFHPHSGVYEWAVTLKRLTLSQNTFGIVLGVVPADDARVDSTQPIGWKSVPGWSLVTGTGRKLHQSITRYIKGPEGIRNVGFTQGESVGVRLDTDKGTLAFFRDGHPLGVAFTGICVPVRPAISCIQGQATTLHSPLPSPLDMDRGDEKMISAASMASLSSPRAWFSWDSVSPPPRKPSSSGNGSPVSADMYVNAELYLNASGSVSNAASKGKSSVSLTGSGTVLQTRKASWRTVCGSRVIEVGTGRHFWSVRLEQLRLDVNTFGMVIGVVPARFRPEQATNQPIGWKAVPGWALVTGTSALLHQSSGLSYPSAKNPQTGKLTRFAEGDTVGVLFDSDRGSLEFFQNSRSLGVAFQGIQVPVRPALSSIGTQKSRLVFKRMPSVKASSSLSIQCKPESVSGISGNVRNVSKKMRTLTSSAVSGNASEKASWAALSGPASDSAPQALSESKIKLGSPKSPISSFGLAPLPTLIRSSEPSWQTTLSESAIPVGPPSGGGIYEWEIEMRSVSRDKNTFAVVFGLASSRLQLGRAVNQPVGWKSSPGFSLVAGTGLKLHNSHTAPFANPFRSGSIVKLRFDAGTGNLEIFKTTSGSGSGSGPNSKPSFVSLGTAFKGLRGEFYPAVSVIQTQEVALSSIRFTPAGGGREGLAEGRLAGRFGWGGFSWDRVKRGMRIKGDGHKVEAGGTTSWQTLVGNRDIRANTGIHCFGIKLVALDLTRNTFGAVVGVVPADFEPSRPRVNQPIGWTGIPGWSLIVSEGRILSNGKQMALSSNKSQVSLRSGDTVGIRIDTIARTLHFYRNGAPIGPSTPAFSNLRFPLRPAASIVYRQIIQLISPLPLEAVIDFKSAPEVHTHQPQQHQTQHEVESAFQHASNKNSKINHPDRKDQRPVERGGREEGKAQKHAQTRRGKRRGRGSGRLSVSSAMEKQPEFEEGMVEVKNLLQGLGLMEYFDKFNEEQVTFETLKCLDLDDLREIVPKFGHRAQIRNSVKKMMMAERKRLEVENQHQLQPSQSSPPGGSQKRHSMAAGTGDGKTGELSPKPNDSSAGSRRDIGREIYRRVLSSVVSGMYMNEGQISQLHQIQKEYALSSEDIANSMQEVGVSWEEIRHKVEKSQQLKQAPAAGGAVEGSEGFSKTGGHASDKGDGKAAKPKPGAAGGAGGGGGGGGGGGEGSSAGRQMAPMEEEEEEPPDAYLCPITDDIMTDPVVAEDGKTYERSAIAQWFQNSDISPITQEKISNRSLLIPNQNLKKLIIEWKERIDRKPRS